MSDEGGSRIWISPSSPGGDYWTDQQVADGLAPPDAFPMTGVRHYERNTAHFWSDSEIGPRHFACRSTQDRIARSDKPGDSVAAWQVFEPECGVVIVDGRTEAEALRLCFCLNLLQFNEIEDIIAAVAGVALPILLEDLK